MLPVSSLALPVGISVLAGLPALLSALLLGAPILRSGRLQPGRLLLSAAIPVILGVLGVCACLAWLSFGTRTTPAMSEILLVNATWVAARILQGALRLGAIALLVPLLLAALAPLRDRVVLSGPSGRGPVWSATTFLVIAGGIALIGGAFHLREGTPATATADGAIVFVAAGLAAVRVLRERTQRLAIVTLVAGVFLLVSTTRWFETQTTAMQALLYAVAPEDRRADGIALAERALLDLVPTLALLLAHAPLLARRVRQRPLATLLPPAGLLVAVLVVVGLLGGWLLVLTDPMVGITRPAVLHGRDVPDAVLPRSERARYDGDPQPYRADLRVELREDATWVNEAAAVSTGQPHHLLAQRMAALHTTGLRSSVGIPVVLLLIAPSDTPMADIHETLTAFRRWRRQDFTLGIAVQTDRRPAVLWLPRCLGPDQDRVWRSEGDMQDLVRELDRRTSQDVPHCYGGP